MGNVKAPANNPYLTPMLMQDLQPNSTALGYLSNGATTSLPSNLQSLMITPQQVNTSWDTAPALSDGQLTQSALGVDRMLPAEMQLNSSVNPYLKQADNLIGSSSLQDAKDYQKTFYDAMELPSLGAAAEASFLSGNQGNSGESTFGSTYLSNQNAAALAQAALQGQQYYTNNVNNAGSLINDVNNERSNFFGNNVNLASNADQMAINRGLALDQLDLSGQTANQSAALQAGEANQNFTLGGMSAINGFNTTAAGELFNNQNTEASNVNQYQNELQNQQLQASEATAANRVGLLTGGTSLLGGAIGLSRGSGIFGGGSSSYGGSNGNLGSSLGYLGGGAPSSLLGGFTY